LNIFNIKRIDTTSSTSKRQRKTSSAKSKNKSEIVNELLNSDKTTRTKCPWTWIKNRCRAKVDGQARKDLGKKAKRKKRIVSLMKNTLTDAKKQVE
jgi:hypothetical protein